jgi:hypothetical protein
MSGNNEHLSRFDQVFAAKLTSIRLLDILRPGPGAVIKLRD